MPNDFRKSTEKLVLANRHLVVICCSCLSDLSGIRQLAKRGLTISDGKCLYTTGDRTGHQCSDRARINTTTKKHPERHIAHQPHADRFFEPVATICNP